LVLEQERDTADSLVRKGRRGRGWAELATAAHGVHGGGAPANGALANRVTYGLINVAQGIAGNSAGLTEI